MHDECNKCESTYVIDNSNAHLFVFNKQPEINRLKSNCTYCGHVALFFLTEEVADRAIASGMNTYVEDGYAPATIYQGWLAAMGIELIQEIDITPRQDNKVKWLGHLLEHDLIDFSIEGEIII